ncbi:hypothetical protein ASD52_23325 [Ensifer sp. Root142]|uniref:heavy metal translocating P-type ATPase n=1 Tax=Ensifer sp. Root142 TaxID=1736461 RepID=UPI00070B3668|nr:heavy metal translocating P-type ATPase [Ensifer sp. Root142]KQY76936.1 hypothetical protein ASD52_23325 [Ensifer sp. Root142]
MACCSFADICPDKDAVRSRGEEILLASRGVGNGLRQVTLSTPEVHCAGCIAKIERALGDLQAVESARVNLSRRRVTVSWDSEKAQCPDFIGALARAGYSAHIVTDVSADESLSSFLVALAVAGFCSMNIMILSVSVWSGADPATRNAFHMISAGLALPAVFYSGRIFYASAWRALRSGQTNMDVPISVGIILAFILSLYDTFTGARHVYFDASVSLIFVLLAGRTLDQMMRGKVRSAIEDLQKLIPMGANVAHEDGTFSYTPLEEVQPGMRLLVRSGDRVPVDAVVHEGGTEIDSSLVSGESRWRSVDVGATLSAGVLNAGSPILVVATKNAGDSFLAEMARMVDAAESARTNYRRVADRAAALYSPVVHSIAAITLAGWLYVSGDLHQAVTTAIAVLIITCPCALGLAVPMVQVVATRRLFERGIMVRDGSALERVCHARTVLFDKTGTLTFGLPQLVKAEQILAGALGIATSLAQLSNHPVARAVADAGTRAGSKPEVFDSVDEIHGLGIEGRRHGQTYRLGRASWATNLPDFSRDFDGTASVLTRDDQILAVFEFEDVVRPGASELVQTLRAGGTSLGIVSGDNNRAVSRVANRLGIERYSAELLPADKVAAIRALQSSSDKVVMVGDGLNDAPALAAADVSIAPSTASDIGRNHADFIFLGDNLLAVRDIIETAKRANDLVRQNFGFAVAYNVVSIPFAIAGSVTPLAAAIAMSLSSVLVVCNSMRLASPIFRWEQWSGHTAVIS